MTDVYHQSTERYLAWQETGFVLWNIKPLEISGLWDHILGEDWWYMFEEAKHIQKGFIGIIDRMTEKADDPEGVYEVELDVDYWIGPCPFELGFFGYSQGSGPWNFFRIDASPEGPILTSGWVRKVRMVPISERSLHGQGQGLRS